MSKDNNPQTRIRTYNARIHSNLTLAREFLRRGVEIEAYQSFDGGGSCGYIVEFLNRDDLDAFVRESGPPTPKTWIEHEDGRIEYLSGPQADNHTTTTRQIP